MKNTPHQSDPLAAIQKRGGISAGQVQKGNAVVIIVVVIAIAAAALLLWNRGGNDTSLNPTVSPTLSPSTSPSLSPSPNTSVSPTATPRPTTSPAASIKTFTVIGSPFKFSMSEIRVKKGDTVKIVFQNQVGMHDWRVDEFNAGTKVIQAGQQDTVQFVADRTGRFEYYCSVPNHRAQGMKGTLIVE